MAQGDHKSSLNVLRRCAAKARKSAGAGLSHIPKAVRRERGAGSIASPTRLNFLLLLQAPCSLLPDPLAGAPPARRSCLFPCGGPGRGGQAGGRLHALPGAGQEPPADRFRRGHPHAALVFIGEAPGVDEDRQGEPFVGRAGQLLTDIITKGMKLRREDVYIMNILRCRPPDNRTPLPDEAANCREYLDAQLSIIQPQYICCLGAWPRRTCWASTRQSASSAAG